MQRLTLDARPLLLRREAAALRLGISLRTLDSLVATKQLKVVKIGGIGSKRKRCLISEDAIREFISKGEADSKRGR